MALKPSATAPKVLAAADIPSSLNPSTFTSSTATTAVSGINTSSGIAILGAANSGTGVSGTSATGQGVRALSASAISAFSQSSSDANTSSTNVSKQAASQSPTVKAYEVQLSDGTPVASIDFNGDLEANDADLNDVITNTIGGKCPDITVTNLDRALLESESGSFVQLIHTSGAARAITLPAAPADGTWYDILLYSSIGTELTIDAGSAAFSDPPSGALDGVSIIACNVSPFTGFCKIVYSSQITSWLLISYKNLDIPV